MRTFQELVTEQERATIRVQAHHAELIELQEFERLSRAARRGRQNTSNLSQGNRTMPSLKSNLATLRSRGPLAEPRPTSSATGGTASRGSHRELVEQYGQAAATRLALQQRSAAGRSVDLLEYAIAAPEGRVDRSAGVLYGVKVLGLVSKNGRTYTEAAARSAVPLYEGVAVYTDHKIAGGRSVNECVGELRNAAFRNGAIYADLHLRKESGRFNELCEAAERFPNRFGLSHHASGAEVKRGGRRVVDKIEAVHSVDIVCRPATTDGFFESAPTAPTSKDGIRATLLSRGRDSSQSLAEGVVGSVLDVTNDGKVDEADLEKIRKVLDATGLSPMDKMSRIADLLSENEGGMLRLKSKLLPDDLKKLANTPDTRPIAEEIATRLVHRSLAGSSIPTSRDGVRSILCSRR